MKIVIDTSVIIAVITNEIHKQKLITITRGLDLIAPSSLHWEIGNAFSAMFRRKRITIDEVAIAIANYKRIPINFINIELDKALELSFEHKIYAYDAYFLVCAKQHKSNFLTLDKKLSNIAQKIGINIKEV